MIERLDKVLERSGQPGPTELHKLLQELLVGRCFFLTTHRLGTLKCCNAILRIEHGWVVAFEPRPPAALAGTLAEEGKARG